MIALSIRQPWVDAILHQGKEVENRSWRTSYRGRVLLHASSRSATKQDMSDYRATCSMAGVEMTDKPAIKFVMGGFVGLATITDCVEHHPSPWFFGPFGFVLADVNPLPLMPFRGMLGFFDVPEGIHNFYRIHHGIELQ